LKVGTGPEITSYCLLADSTDPVLLIAGCGFLLDRHFNNFEFKRFVYIGFSKVLCIQKADGILQILSAHLPLRCHSSFMTSGVENVTVTPSFESDFQNGEVKHRFV